MNYPKTIYLDYAAATPVDPAVLKTMQPYYTDNFYNPSATYLAAKSVAADLKKARESVAFSLGAKPSEIVFTAGGTEANNLAIAGIIDQYPGSNIIVSAIEHESILEPANKYDYREAKVTKGGIVDLDYLEKLIDDNTVLISVMYANNEIGTIQPIKEIAKLLQNIRKARANSGDKLPIFLHTDACQASNYLDLHTSRLGVDLMTLNGGKMYGPKQSGALYVRTGVVVSAQILGGGQERGLRSGTENVASIIGFAKALEIAQEKRPVEAKRLTELRDDFVYQLKANFPDAIINGSLKKRLPNNISVTFPGTDNERLMMQLDEKGIMCAVGSACSASNDEPSHVLKSIGLPDEKARSTLRFSLGRDTTINQIKETLRSIQQVL